MLPSRVAAAHLGYGSDRGGNRPAKNSLPPNSLCAAHRNVIEHVLQSTKVVLYTFMMAAPHQTADSALPVSPGARRGRPCRHRGDVRGLPSDDGDPWTGSSARRTSAPTSSPCTPTPMTPSASAPTAAVAVGDLGLRDRIDYRSSPVARLPLDEKLVNIKTATTLTLGTALGRVSIPFDVAGYARKAGATTPPPA